MDKALGRILELPAESLGQRGYRLRQRRAQGKMTLPLNPPKPKVEVLTARQVRNREKKRIVAENNVLRLPVAVRTTQEVFEDNIGRRVKYAAMRTHQEQAAIALASGFSIDDAAHRAGVSRSRVRRYMENADFRERVSELRQLLFSGVQGRIIQELDRRFTQTSLMNTELMDMLRVLDRSMGGKDKGLADITVNNYEAIFAQLSAAVSNPQAESEGEDFPEYGPEDLLLPGGDTPVD